MADKEIKIDASGERLGRLAAQVAVLLRGKQKPGFQKNIENNDIIEVFNITQLNISDKKKKEKIYYRHSGYPGGLKEETLQEKLDKNPSEIFRLAVLGMLPKNRMRAKLIKKLKIKD